MNVTDTMTISVPVPGTVAGAGPGTVPKDGWTPLERLQEDVKTVSVCDTQPVTAEGIRTLLGDNSNLQFAQVTDSLARAKDICGTPPPRS